MRSGLETELINDWRIADYRLEFLIRCRLEIAECGPIRFYRPRVVPSRRDGREHAHHAHRRRRRRQRGQGPSKAALQCSAMQCIALWSS